MAWQIELGEAAFKQLASLDRASSTRILRYLRERVATLANPRDRGKPLKGSDHASLWRYRVGDFRVFANIEDARLTVLVLRIGHRRNVYQP